MDSREQRLARNENLFARSTSAVREIASVHGATCTSTSSTASARTRTARCGLELPLRDYERVREHGDRFLIAPGHNLPDIERIVERTSTGG
jgi:hypothetical protein